jgi:hypothetical protein
MHLRNLLLDSAVPPAFPDMHERLSLDFLSSRVFNLLAQFGVAVGVGVVGFFACAGAVGCGQAASDAPFETVYNPCRPLVVEAQAGVDPQESASLDAAIELWNAVGPLKLTREPVADAPTIPVYFEDGAAFMHGYYSDELGTVTVNHQLSPREHIITLAHELGHAFGLHHVERETRRSLMNPGNLHTGPTPADVKRLMGLWPECRGEATSDNSDA